MRRRAARLLPLPLEDRDAPARTVLPAADTPIHLPAFEPVSSTIVVADPVPVTDLNVRVSLAGADPFDRVFATLRGPDGQTAELTSAFGSTRPGDGTVTFSDEAFAPVPTGARATELRPETPLAVFDGPSAAGTWTLELTAFGSGEPARLVGWELSIDSSAAVQPGPVTDFPSADVPQPITDFNLTTSSLTVPESFPVAAVEVAVDVTHPFVGDLSLFLIAPDGTEVLLVEGFALPGENYTGTVFADNGAELFDAEPPYTGRFRPAEPLAAFTGIDPRGEWQLQVIDTAFGDEGTLDSWSLRLIGPSVTGTTDQADLTLTGLSADRPRATWGDEVSIDFAVTNAGITASEPTVVRVNLSDTTAPSSGEAVGTAVVPAIAPGETFRGTLTVRLPDAPPTDVAPAGLLFLNAVVDPEELSTDADPTNNTGLGLGRSAAAVTVGLPDSVEVVLSPRSGVALTPQAENRFPIDLLSPMRLEDLNVGLDLTAPGVPLASVRAELVAPDGRRLPVSNSVWATSFAQTFLLDDQATGLGRLTPGRETRKPMQPLEEAAGILAAGRWELVLTSGVPVRMNAAWLEADTFVVRPDLAAVSVSAGNPVLRPGGTLSVTVEIVNRGRGASPAGVPVDVYLSADPTVFMDDRPEPLDTVLTRITLPALASGEAYRATLPVPVPATLPVVFLSSPLEAFVGLAVNPDGTTDEARRDNNADGGLGTSSIRLPIQQRRTELEPNNTPPEAEPVTVQTELTAALADPADVDWVRFTLPTDGELSVDAVPAVGAATDPRVQLFTARGELLLQSDDRQSGRPPAGFAQHLPAGEYLLRVSAQGPAGAYRLTTGFVPGNRPFEEVAVGGQLFLMEDVSGDGVPDLIGAGDGKAVNLAVGNGDGTFRPAVTLDTGLFFTELFFSRLTGLAAGDLDGDGRTDLVVAATASAGFAQPASPQLGVLYGRGDGTFRPARLTALPGTDAGLVRLADLDGDGRLDVAVTVERRDPVTVVSNSSLAVLFNGGAGRLLSVREVPLPASSRGLEAVDLDQNGRAELLTATANSFVGFDPFELQVVSVPRDGPAVMQSTPVPVPFTFNFLNLAVGDFTRDGKTDVIVLIDAIQVFAGTGDGGLEPPVSAGVLPFFGRQFSIPDAGGTDLGLVSPEGRFERVRFAGGTFVREVGGTLPSVANLFAADAGDLNGDGRPDFVLTGEAFAQVTLARADGSPATAARSTVGQFPSTLSVGDLNGDGRVDAVVLAGGQNRGGAAREIGVRLSDGAGGFVAGSAVPVPDLTLDTTLADLNGDGRLDLVLGGGGSDGPAIRTRFGRGDGGFVDEEVVYPVPGGTERVLVGDLTGDGWPDVATFGRFTGPNFQSAVTVFPGRPDGRLAEPLSAPLLDVVTINLADVDGDGRLELVAVTITLLPDSGQVAGSLAASLTVARVTAGRQLLFGEPQPLDGPVSFPALTAADLNRDGRADLVVYSADGAVGGVVRLAGSDGRFGPGQRLPIEEDPFIRSGPIAVRPADIDGDGTTDLVVSLRSGPAILTGRGDGTFRAPVPIPNVTVPAPELTGGGFLLQLGDANGDGRQDMFAVDALANELRVFLTANPGTTFRTPPTTDVGSFPSQLLTADLDGDGTAETVAVVNDVDGPAAQVYRPGADESLQLTDTIRLPGEPNSFPRAVTAGDLTGDGRPELLVSRERGFDVVPTDSGPPVSFDLPDDNPVGGLFALSVVDVDGDGRNEVVGVRTTLNNGLDENRAAVAFSVQPDGTVRMRTLLALPGGVFFSQGANNFAAVDVTGDGVADLTERGSLAGQLQSVQFVYPSRGDGTFGPPVASPGVTIDFFDSVQFLDLTGDGFADRLASRRFDTRFDKAGYEVAVNDGTGRFAVAARLSPPGITSLPEPLAAELTGDGRPDVLVRTVVGPAFLFANLGDGRFDVPRPLVNTGPAGDAVAGDLDGDGRPDLVFQPRESNRLQPLLATGFAVTPAAADRAADRTPAPAFGDLTGDGIADALIVDAGGRATVRAGRADGTFAAPVELAAGRRFADVAVVRTPAGVRAAAADAAGVTLYRFEGGGFAAEPDALPTALGPARLLAADFNADGWDDLATANAAASGVTVYLSRAAAGGFDRADANVPGTPTDLAAADTDGDGRPELIVAGLYSSDLSVVTVADGRAELTARYRADTGLTGLGAPTGRDSVRSLDPAVGLAAGRFDDRPGPDLLGVLRATGKGVLLRNAPGGGFADPPAGAGLPLGPSPGRPVAADFDGDGRDDFAVLTRGDGVARAWINVGNGQFRAGPDLVVGPDAFGLAARDADGDGKPDLLVVNRFGDLLVAFGDGTGRFVARNPADAVTLDVTEAGTAKAAVLLANEQADQVRVLDRAGDAFNTRFESDADGGLERPTAVAFADLNRDGSQDLAVANSGRNSVTVYLNRNDGSGLYRRPFELPAGAAPAGVTVADLDADGVPDLMVANEGSNDVSVLLGVPVDGGGYTAVPGPRVRSGGAGPASVIARDQNTDGIMDLVVFNRQSGSFGVVPGVGGGFFDDRAPAVFPLPAAGGDGGTVPRVGPDNMVVVAPAGGGVFAGSLNSLSPTGGGPGLFVPVGLPAGTGAVTAAQPVAVGGGIGVLVGTAGGLFQLLGPGSVGGPADVLGQARANRSEPVSAALAVAAGNGFDVFVAFRGSSDPGLVRLAPDTTQRNPNPDPGQDPFPGNPGIPSEGPGTPTVPPPVPQPGVDPVPNTLAVIPTVGIEFGDVLRSVGAQADDTTAGGRSASGDGGGTATAEASAGDAGATQPANGGTGGTEADPSAPADEAWEQELLNLRRRLAELGLLPEPPPAKEPADPPPSDPPADPPSPKGEEVPPPPSEEADEVSSTDAVNVEEPAAADSWADWWWAVVPSLGYWHRAARPTRRATPLRVRAIGPADE